MLVHRFVRVFTFSCAAGVSARGSPGKPLPLRDEYLPHRFVLVFGFLFGASLVFLSPPFSVPDEPAHFCRAYHCSEGKLYAKKGDGVTGDELPASLADTVAMFDSQDVSGNRFRTSWTRIKSASGIALEPQRRQFISFSNTALYSPVPYLPQSLAIGVARLCRLPPLAMFYLARMANLIAYLLLTAVAVRVIPIHKWTLAMVALMPTAVYLGASLSADAMTLGVALLVLAVVLNLALRGDGPVRRGLLAVGFLLVFLALSKQAYVGLALLCFMVPGKRFSSPATRWLLAVILIGVPLAIDAAWTYSLRGLYVPMLPRTEHVYVDPPAQVGWILAHPGTYAVMLLKAVYGNIDCLSMVGTFGWLEAHLPHWTRVAYWIVLGTTAVLDGGNPLPLNLRARVVAAITYLFTFAVMSTFVYLSWTSVGAPSIDGTQPRYFLPIVPLLLLLPRGGARLAASRFSRAVVPVAAMSMTIVAAAVTWCTMVKNYY
jgi:uncharacterized membrane protein